MTDDTRTPTTQDRLLAAEWHAIEAILDRRSADPGDDAAIAARAALRLAEARDATGLRLDADLTERLSDHFGHAHSTYACNCGDRFRAALATTPPEPRLPTRDECPVCGDSMRITTRCHVAPPPEPRWPSRDELATELYGVSFVAHQWEPDDRHTRINVRSFELCPQPRCVEMRRVLAALREGEERP